MVTIENKIDIDGCIFYYKTAGNTIGKPTVIFETGYNGTADSWDLIFPVVANQLEYLLMIDLH